MRGSEATGRSLFADVDGLDIPLVLCEYLDQFARDPGIVAVKQRARDLLALRPGDVVLDVGCGTGGEVASYAGPVGRTGLAVGVDLSEAMLAEAARRRPGEATARMALAHSHRLPFGDASFTAVHSERLLIHDPCPAVSISELARVAAPGACVVVVEPDFASAWLSHTDPITTGRMLRFGLARWFASPYVARDLASLLAASRIGQLRIERRNVRLPFVLADMVMEFKPTVASAREAGIVGDEAVSWLTELEQRDADGTFACTVPMTTVRGWRTGTGG